MLAGATVSTHEVTPPKDSTPGYILSSQTARLEPFRIAGPATASGETILIHPEACTSRTYREFHVAGSDLDLLGGTRMWE